MLEEKEKITARHRKQRQKSLPSQYEPGFIDRLDGRTEVYREISKSYSEVIEDCGGGDSLSHTQLCLIERFVFLEAVLKVWESKIVTDPNMSDSLLGKWVQSLNSLQGLAKNIGLKRVTRRVDSLQSYVSNQKVQQ